MFVHGGISEDDVYLNDCHLLNLNQLKWSSCFLDVDLPAPSLACHTACLVVSSDLSDNPRMNIYKFPEIGSLRRQISNVQ